MESILRTDLKYLNKENKKSRIRFITQSIIIFIFIFLFYSLLMLNVFANKTYLYSHFRNNMEYVEVEDSNLNLNYNYTSKYKLNSIMDYCDNKTGLYAFDYIEAYDEKKMLARYSFKYVNNNFDGAILSYDVLKKSVKDPKSLIGKYITIRQYDKEDFTIDDDFTSFYIPIVNLYYENKNIFSTIDFDRSFLVNKKCLEELHDFNLSSITNVYEIPKEDFSSLNLDEAYHYNLNDLLETANSDFADIFIFLRTFSIVFIIICVACFGLFVFIFNKNINKSFIIRYNIGTTSRYIRMLRILFISLNFIFSFVVSALVFTLGFLIVSRIIYYRLYVGPILSFIFSGIGLSLLIAIALITIITILLNVFYNLKSNLNPKIVVSFVFLIIATMFLCVCQKNIHLFDYERECYKDFNKNYLYVKTMYHPYVRQDNRKSRKKEDQKIEKIFESKLYKYSYYAEYRGNNSENYIYSSNDLLNDGIDMNFRIGKIQIINKQNEREYCANKEYAEENGFSYIKITTKKRDEYDTVSEENFVNYSFSYSDDIKKDLLTQENNELVYRIYFVLEGTKSELKKAYKELQDYESANRFNEPNFYELRLGYQERNLLYHLNLMDKIILTLGVIPIVITIIIIYFANKALVKNYDYDNRIKRLLGIGKLKLLISIFLEGIFIFFIPSVIALAFSYLYSIVIYKVGYPLLTINVVLLSTLCFVILIAAMETNKIYREKLTFHI